MAHMRALLEQLRELRGENARLISDLDERLKMSRDLTRTERRRTPRPT